MFFTLYLVKELEVKFTYKFLMKLRLYTQQINYTDAEMFMMTSGNIILWMCDWQNHSWTNNIPSHHLLLPWKPIILSKTPQTGTPSPQRLPAGPELGHTLPMPDHPSHTIPPLPKIPHTFCASVTLWAAPSVPAGLHQTSVQHIWHGWVVLHMLYRVNLRLGKGSSVGSGCALAVLSVILQDCRSKYLLGCSVSWFLIFCYGFENF